MKPEIAAKILRYDEVLDITMRLRGISRHSLVQQASVHYNALYDVLKHGKNPTPNFSRKVASVLPELAYYVL